MNRHVVAAAFAALLALSAPLSAQYPGATGPSPRLRITPFGAFLPGFDRHEEWAHRGDFLSNVNAVLRMSAGGSVGVNLEYALVPVVGINLSAAVGRRGDTLFDVEENAETFRIAGNDFVLARAAIVFFMQQQPSLVIRRVTGSLFAGGTLLYERPQDKLGTRAILDPSATHPGVHFGGTLEVPFASDRLALQAGVEDNLIFWRERPLTALAWEYFEQPGCPEARCDLDHPDRDNTHVEVDLTHMFVIRAGLSFRFR